MNLGEDISIKEIAQFIGAEIVGNDQIQINSINEIHKVQKGSLIFVDNEKYYNRAIYSAATAIIINQVSNCPVGKALLIVDDPFAAYNKLAKYYNPFKHINAQICASAEIGEGTIIEPGVVIGEDVKIGSDCLIRANTVIHRDTEIGNRVVIHSNASIGNDAFYYHKKSNKSYEAWHSIGRVLISDDVEIGAGTTIDRGVSGDTIIGLGTKIDNLVHIGHGVVIGKHCLLAAQVGIAGKTTIQDYVTIYGQVGVSKSLVVGESATLLAKTGVSKSIPGGDQQYIGIPAGEARRRFREMAALRQLPQLLQDFEEMKKMLTLLKEHKK